MKEKIAVVLGNLDRGFYHQAKGLEGGPRSSYGYLTDLLAEGGVSLDEKALQARVGALAYKLGYSPQQFAMLPENAQAAIEQHAYDTFGLAKALEFVGITVKGARADRMEKFFGTSSSTILFPAYVESQVVSGMLSVAVLSNLIATESNIDSHTYQSLALTDTEDDRQLRRVSEGGLLPTTRIQTADRAVQLFKFGRLLEASYESMRLKKLNVVSIFLQKLGKQIALDETDWAIETLIAGDGNVGSAVTPIMTDSSGTLDYDDLTKLFLAFPSGYTMNTAVVNSINLRTILNMSEFKDPMAGFSFQRTGTIPGPMGAAWYRWDSTGSSAFSTDRILAVDSSLALEQVTEQGVMTESDKLIDRQLERTAISKWTGFAKLDYQAIQVLDITH